MPTQDDEFIKQLRETFSVEAAEHLQSMASMLLELEKAPPSAQGAETIEKVYREAHSLKGAARAVDLSGIEAICQSLESVFSEWKRGKSTPSPEVFDTLHSDLDEIHALLARAGADSTGGALERGNRSPGAEVAPRLPLPIQPAPSQLVESENAAVAATTVRIPIAKLNARLLQAEDMLLVKAMAAQRAAELKQVTALFDQWHREWAKVSIEARILLRSRKPDPDAEIGAQPIAASAKLAHFIDWNCDYFRSLENRLNSLATRAKQDCQGVGKRVDDLLEDSKNLLLMPFSTLSVIFPRLVREICRNQGKEVDLVIRGAEVEIDNRILEEMKDVLIHVLRNCVDHGVETPAERVRLGKPERANITISVSQVNGRSVEIVVSDDGAGVDLERVKDAAVAQGILSEIDARALDEPDALALIFQSGVSSSPTVTGLSGRGLGMAIVREKTGNLGGRTSIESKRHVGTSLRMVLPLTLATFRGIVVSADGRKFVVPTVHVERAMRVKPQDIRTVGNRQTVSLQARIVSLARLAAVLELPPKTNHDDAGVAVPVVVLHSAGQRIAFAVDEILQEEEVLVKPFRKPLLRVRNITGATVLGSGQVVPILNVADLLISARTHGAPPGAALPGPARERSAPTNKVLVVDDSVTSRMLLKGILESAGYQVKTAVDGVEAFTALHEDGFDLVVSDVEMPRMNGFDLTAKIRRDKRLVDLPIVLITALESRQERERGIDAGASAYIIKSSFDQSNLLEIIRRLV
ncbi:MAG: CheA signal transduction histidine kinase [Phycisphaerales bacterium]|nr:CheA signal transduction histidine kinase [Phycisphaerales bacterium]